MRRRLPRINIKKIFQYLTLTVVSAIVILFVLASLPFTEKYLKTTSLNVIVSDTSLASKQYKAEITFTDDQLKDKWKLINETKDTLYSRLRNYGVEYIRIEYQETEQKKGNILVSVYTTKDITKVQSLVSTRGDIKIMVKKDEANFDDEKNQYAKYMESNYNETGLTKDDFRTFYVTQLKTTSGDQAYFAILKPYIWKESKYDKFLIDNSGKEGGFSLDGFVTPTTIPVYSANVSAGSAKPIFAVGVASDNDTAILQDIVFNSGDIPIDYSFKEATDIKINGPKFDYYKVFALAIVCVAISSVILLYTNKEFRFKSLVSAAFAFITVVNILKFTQTPTLSLTLLIALILSVIFAFYLDMNEEKYVPVIFTLGILGIIYALGLSISSILFPALPILVLAIPLSSYLMDVYSDLFNTTIRK